MLRYGVLVKMEERSLTQSVFLFNYQNPLNNNYAVAEEVIVIGAHDKR
jgi:type I restriction enzyme, R subunit